MAFFSKLKKFGASIGRSATRTVTTRVRMEAQRTTTRAVNKAVRVVMPPRTRAVRTPPIRKP